MSQIQLKYSLHMRVDQATLENIQVMVLECFNNAVTSKSVAVRRLTHGE
jgi:hypothetical protein